MSIEPSENNKAVMYRDAIDLRKLALALWYGRATILWCVAATLILAVVYMHITTYYHTATLTVVPTQSQGRSMSGGLGELASLAGVDLSNNQNVSPFSIYPEELKSRAVADEMTKRYPEIMHRIFADQWNESEKRWAFHRGITGGAVAVLKGILGIPQTHWNPPGGAELQEYIRDHIQTSLDTKKPILTLSFDHPDPVFAVQFVQAVHATTDQALRRMTLQRSSKYAQYLEAKLPTVQLAELRQVMMDTLGQQETLIMMSNSDTPFAAQPLSAATSSLRPTKPKAVFVLSTATVLGALLGAALVLLGISLHPDALSLFRWYKRRWHGSPDRLSTATDLDA